MMPQRALSSEVAVRAASLDGPTRIINDNGPTSLKVVSFSDTTSLFAPAPMAANVNVTKDKLAQHQPNCFLDDEKARQTVALAALTSYDQTNPKPKRPLSAYNLFFRFERARILSAQAEMMRVRKERANNNNDEDEDDDDDDNATGSAAIDASLDEVLSSLSPIDANVSDPDDPIQRAQLFAEITDKLTNNPFHTDRSNRKHRKSHGMISFPQLIQLMSSRWREVCGDGGAPSKNKSPLVKSIFEELANEGRTVYKAKMKKWREARAALENTVDPKGLVQANKRLANGASQGSANKKRKAESTNGNAHVAAAAPTDVFSNLEAFVQNPSASIHQNQMPHVGHGVDHSGRITPPSLRSHPDIPENSFHGPQHSSTKIDVQKDALGYAEISPPPSKLNAVQKSQMQKQQEMQQMSVQQMSVMMMGMCSAPAANFSLGMNVHTMMMQSRRFPLPTQQQHQQSSRPEDVPSSVHQVVSPNDGIHELTKTDLFAPVAAAGDDDDDNRETHESLSSLLDQMENDTQSSDGSIDFEPTPIAANAIQSSAISTEPVLSEHLTFEDPCDDGLDALCDIESYDLEYGLDSFLLRSSSRH